MKTWLKNLIRKMRREAFAEDLMLIRPEYRHLYRGRFGNPGSGVSALWEATVRGHIKDRP